MEWIENQMAEEMYDVPTEDDMEDFVGGIVQITAWSYKTIEVAYAQ